MAINPPPHHLVHSWMSTNAHSVAGWIEKILLPTVPAIIKVITAQAGLVRLGIERPSHVPILREELTRNDKHPGLPPADLPTAKRRTCAHTVRNRLNNLILGLTLLHAAGRLRPGRPQDLDGLEEELRAMRRQVMACGAEGPELAVAAESASA
ncbi:MAG: carbon storage regulator [Gemmataceae bacterium]